MYQRLYNFLPAFTFAVVTAGLLLAPSFSDNAHAQCVMTVCKSASGPDGVFFPFTATQDGQIEPFELADDGNCLSFPFSGSNLQIVEGVVPGWIFLGAECDVESTAITDIDHGLEIDCVDATLQVTCEYINVFRSAENIPTLSEWGMFAAAAGLALVGVFFALRRRKAFNS